MLCCKAVPSLAVHQGEQYGDGVGPAGGCVLADEAPAVYVPEGLEEFLEPSGAQGLRQVGVGGLRILIGRVVREVRTDDEEILPVEIRVQDLGNALEQAEALGPDHNRDDGRDFVENHLEERQLHLEAMLLVVGVAPESESPVAFLYKFFPKGNVYRNPAQGRLCIGIQRIHARPGESHPVAGPNEEYPLVGMTPGNAAECGRRHLAAEYVPRMGYYQRLRRRRILIGKMQPFSQH